MRTDFKNTIILKGKEDYTTIGNSRMGGKPDLPRGMDYPVFINGFYEFILQLNLNDFKINGLPQKGIISIFYGNFIKNEAKVYYFENIDDLELKEVPINYPFAGATDFSEHNSYKLGIEPKQIPPRKNQPMYNDKQFTEEENIMHWRADFLYDNSYLLDNGIENRNELYLKINGFDSIKFNIRIDDKKEKIEYIGRTTYKEYLSIEDLIQCDITKSYETTDYRRIKQEKWLDQLEQFEKEKEYHIQRFKSFNCLLSISSSNKVGITGANGFYKLEFYGYESEFKIGNFTNLFSTRAM